MTDPLKLADEVLALDKTATQGPWRADLTYGRTHKSHFSSIVLPRTPGELVGSRLGVMNAETQDQATDVWIWTRPETMAFIIHTRTSSPILAQAVKDMAERIRELEEKCFDLEERCFELRGEPLL